MFEILCDQIVKTVGLILQCISLESLLCFVPSVAKYGNSAYKSKRADIQATNT